MPEFHFTYFRLVTKTKKLRTTKIFGHAKNWIVITFGLKDIAVLATFAVLRLTGWLSKRKRCTMEKYRGMQKFG